MVKDCLLKASIYVRSVGLKNVRDKNGVAIPDWDGVLGWDEYQKWLYDQPIDDNQLADMELE